MDLSFLMPYLVTIAVAWTIAHVIKYAIATVQTRSARNFGRFFASGDMPSAHTTTTVALMVAIGLNEGFASAIFALAALFTGVVMYDAVTVRRSSGEQGQALTALLKEQKSNVPVPMVAKGHTPLELLVGALLGALISLVIHVIYVAA